MELELLENPIITSSSEIDSDLREAAAKTIIAGLIRRRYGYDDTIPEDLKHSYSPKGILVKARKAWFTEIASFFEDVIWLELIKDARVVKKLERGIIRFTSKRFCNTVHHSTSPYYSQRYKIWQSARGFNTWQA